METRKRTTLLVRKMIRRNRKVRFRGRERGGDHRRLILQKRRGYGVFCGQYGKLRIQMDGSCFWSLRSCRTRNYILIITRRLRNLLRWILSRFGPLFPKILIGVEKDQETGL